VSAFLQAVTDLAALAFAGAVGWLVLYGKAWAQRAVEEPAKHALEELKQEHVRQLESVKAEHALRATEFGLFAREKHRAYARVFRKYRIACDALVSLRGLMTLPDFTEYSLENVRDYLATNKVVGTVAADIEDTFAADARKGARDLTKVTMRIREQRARDLLTRAINADILESLYFSDAVAAQAERVRTALAEYMAMIEDREPGRAMSTLEKGRAGRAAVDELYRLMRAELMTPGGQPSANA
jgi:hypothetical protein